MSVESELRIEFENLEARERVGKSFDIFYSLVLDLEKGTEKDAKQAYKATYKHLCPVLLDESDTTISYILSRVLYRLTEEEVSGKKKKQFWCISEAKKLIKQRQKFQALNQHYPTSPSHSNTSEFTYNRTKLKPTDDGKEDQLNRSNLKIMTNRAFNLTGNHHERTRESFAGLGREKTWVGCVGVAA